MDIKELQSKKHEIESIVEKLLNGFMEETDLKVEDLSIDYIKVAQSPAECWKGIQKYAVNVTMKASL